MRIDRLTALIFLMLMFSPLFGEEPAGINWYTDYSQALSMSQHEQKPLLLFFNGSDWAPYAMKMKHEVLNDPAFQEKIGTQFICMEVDFPKYTSQSESVATQNVELKNRFNIQDLPLLILMDSRERVIAQFGYLPEKGERLAADLLQVIQQDAQLLQGLASLGQDSVQLKKLYQLACDLGRQHAMEQIVQVGLQTEDPYFCLERYRFLVESGAMKSDEALALRQKLLTLSQNTSSVNEQGILFTLALIDFQELSQKNEDPEIATRPLVEYLANCSDEDKKNIWRVEMMIAEVFLDADRWEEALKYAEKALQAAPANMREEIAHSLDYIRSSTQSS